MLAPSETSTAPYPIKEIRPEFLFEATPWAECVANQTIIVIRLVT